MEQHAHLTTLYPGVQTIRQRPVDYIHIRGSAVPYKPDTDVAIAIRQECNALPYGGVSLCVAPNVCLLACIALSKGYTLREIVYPRKHVLWCSM